MKRASAASDDLEAELDHRIGVGLAVLRSPCAVSFCDQAHDIIRPRRPVYNSRTSLQVRMSRRAEAFEHWIRTSFVQMNTELENLYFAQENRAQVIGCGDPIKASLRDEGHAHVVALLAEGNTGEGFDSAYGVLGSVGLYLGALRRHELTNPAREERSPFPEASSLALHVGASLGMAPRFSTGHLATHNRARAGVRKSFTSLRDEFLFIDENTRGILSLQRAADALASIVHLGVSSPVADVMFDAAKQALRDVIRFNDRLMNQLDVERFFYSVRPYYKPYRVGRQEYRGANAGARSIVRR